MTREEFTAAYGGIFESSPWVAEEAYADGPFEGVDDLHAAMVGVVERAGAERQVALIRAHPDLAGRAAIAGELTDDSTREQAAAGLDRLTPAQFARFQELNGAYRERFGFPFVICAREHDAASILDAFDERLGHDRDAEVSTALREIAKIARLRLEERLT